MIEFGVGKFGFIAEGHDGPGDRGASVPAERLEAALKEMPNVTDLKMEGGISRMSFVISIPRHLQEGARPDRRVSERFRFRSMDGYHSDFTFIASLEPVDPFSGSDGVRIVRQQLAKQLRDSSGISLKVQGPSPFHANFRVLAHDLNEGGQVRNLPIGVLVGNVTARRGFDHAVFAYNPLNFDSELSALDALQYELAGELTLFYELAARREERLRAAMEIGESTEHLINLHSATGISGAYNRLFRSGRKARALALDVMQAEFAVAQDRERYREASASLYSHTDGYFRKYLVSEATEEFMAHVDNGAQVVRHLETGRSKELELAIIAGATLVGGISGGVVSAIVGAG